jgi:tetratricopeptide (TPR) repeat protein
MGLRPLALSILLAAAVPALAAPKTPCFSETGEKAVVACTMELKAKWQTAYSRPITLRRRADLYFDLHKYDKAIADLTTVINSRSATADDWRERGNDYWWAGRLDLALKDHKTAYGMQPGNYTIVLDYAEALLADNKSTEAYNLVTRSVAADTDNARHHDIRSRAAIAVEYYTIAIWSSEKATKLAPRVAGYWYDLGRAQEYSGNINEAIKAYSEAISQDHFIGYYYAARASLFYMQGKYGESLAGYDLALKYNLQGQWHLDRAAVRLAMDDVRAARADVAIARKNGEPQARVLTIEGRIEAHEKHYDKALTAYNKAIRLNPAYTSARYWKAVAFIDQDKHAAALPLLDQAAREWANDASVAAEKANTLLELGRKDEAIKTAFEAVKRDGHAVYPLEVRSRIYNYLGSFDQAIADADAALRLDDHSTIAWYRKGYALRQQGQIKASIAAYDKMVALSPKFANGRVERARAFVDDENFVAAKADIDMAMALQGESAELLGLLGWYHEKQRQYPESLAAYDKAVALNPKDGWSYEARGWGKISAGNPVAAAADCRVSIKLLPEAAAPWRCLARAQENMQQLDESTTSLQTAVKTDHTFGQAWFDLGYNAMMASNYGSAIEHFTHAIDNKTWLAWSYLYRGDSYKRMGLRKSALRDYNLALAQAKGDMQQAASLRIQQIDATGIFNKAGAPEYPQARHSRTN